MKLFSFKRIIWLNLIAIIALLLIYPHLMISPGQLIEGHQPFSTDCFACHQPFTGSAPQRCIACHKVADIGRLTTSGMPIQTPKTNVPFHHNLQEQDCVACHSDHQGMKPYRAIRTFSHQLLAPALQENCRDCHQAPQDKLHRKFEGNCAQCHEQRRWTPATFAHDSLSAKSLAQCASCHEKPQDTLHSKLKENCTQCHDVQQWKPATFEHSKYFRFDGNHETNCDTCHIQGDYTRYTCYGCHEHNQAKIRAEHYEEGIRNYENCVECHRSGNEEEAKRGEHGGRGEEGEHDDD